MWNSENPNFKYPHEKEPVSKEKIRSLAVPLDGGSLYIRLCSAHVFT